MREVLRASQSNYRLDRVPGLEWQDDVADMVATALVQGATSREAVVAATAGRTEPQLHLRWACQDGIARGVLRLQAERSLFDFVAEEAVADTTAGPPLPPPPPAS